METEPAERPHEPSRRDAPRTIVVPVTDPAIVETQLGIAAGLCGDEGRVIALQVVVDDRESEEQAEHDEELSAVVERFDAGPDLEVQLSRREAATVSRGILDAVNETRADVVLLTVPSETNGRLGIGSVAANVVEVAPCAVVLFRRQRAQHSPVRVVLSSLGDAAFAAAKVAVRLAERSDLPLVALATRPPGQLRSVATAGLDRALASVEAPHVERRIIDSSSPRGIVGELSPGDLVVTSVERSDLSGRWSRFSTSRRILESAPGAVLVVVGTPSSGMAARLMKTIRSLRPALTELERETVVSRAEAGAGISGDFVILVTVAALLASFGLLQNSAAVVIGAMLVAPFLGPLSATSVALVTGRLDIGWRSALTLLTGAAIALGWANVAGHVVPLDSPTAEMLSRGSPSFLDATVAMAAGLVGAYATARKDIPAALAGVAIAAALVPPLCTAGLALAFGDWQLASGAFLLFTTNVVAMVVVGLAVFWWLGMRPTVPSGRLRYVSIVVIALATLSVVFAMLRVTQQASQASLAAGDLRELFPDAEVVSVTSRGADPVEVTAVVRTADDIGADDVAEVESRLEDRFGIELDLEVVVERVVRSG